MSGGKKGATAAAPASAAAPSKKVVAKARAAWENSRTAAVRALLWRSDGGEPVDLLADLSALCSMPAAPPAPGGGGGGPAVRITFAAPRCAGGAAAADAALEDALFALTKANMEPVYNDEAAGPGWRWSDSRKRGELFDRETRFLVARAAGGGGEDDGELLAFLAFRLQCEGEFELLYVYELQAAPAARRRGIGRRLMQLAELLARRCGVQWVMLTVLKHNAGARDFYARKMGYTASEEHPICADRSMSHEVLGKAVHAATARARTEAAAAFAAGRLPAEMPQLPSPATALVKAAATTPAPAPAAAAAAPALAP